ncbi:MAG: GH92 family glycosyl hydrolase [Bacteroidales bacterium]
MTNKNMFLSLTKKAILPFLAGAVAFSLPNEGNAQSKKQPTVQCCNHSLVQYVKPLVGTQNDGNVYPGAQIPFGGIQISPDTDTRDWGSAAGYEYSDSTILGFSLTHLSGTGIPDLGDFLFIPGTGAKQFVAGDKKAPDSGYRSRYSHDKEIAGANYYAVDMLDFGVKAEMTSGKRAGMFRFTYPQTDTAYVIVDLFHSLQWAATWSSVRFENDSTITGFRLVKGWGRERYVYFAAVFSQPFKRFGIVGEGQPIIYNTRRFRSSQTYSGTNIQAWMDFGVEKGGEIDVKVAVSSVSASNALANLAELNGKNFNCVKQDGEKLWEKELGKFVVEGTQTEKETFYTAAYHAFIHPFVYEDSNGDYRGHDANIHKADHFENYTVFSLWDTYRAVHPLFNFVQRERNADMINSMLAYYDQSVDKLLPIWAFYGNETWCMIGYHAVPVIADAIVKDVKGFDYERAYEAIKTTAMNKDYDALEAYRTNGWVPFDKEPEAVSKTLEYAYDDYTIAMAAKKLGKEEDYKYFINRALSYQNLVDPQGHFMRGRDLAGNWRQTNHRKGKDYTEGSTWQYTWYVPQDVQGLVNEMGGVAMFKEKLDSVFMFDKKGNLPPIQAKGHGSFGNFWHGNEPSHHIPYLYNYIGEPWKAQKLVRLLVNTQYGNTPDALCGNDDCGQMSCWYIFNTMGFYPIAPSSGVYPIGSPALAAVTMNMDGGKQLKVTTENWSAENFYIKKVYLNGKEWKKTWFSYDDLKNGAEIKYVMSATPTKWGTDKAAYPPSLSESGKTLKYSKN